MLDSEFNESSRRGFVLAGGGALGGLWLSARFPLASRAAAEAGRIAAGEVPPDLAFFTPAEMTTVQELVALIIPTDDTPGAREAGAAFFIDRALAGFASDLAVPFRAGLTDLARRLREAHPKAASLADLGSAARAEFLRSNEDTSFVRLAAMLTAWGTFCDPSRGGNRDRSGWRMIGFDDRHAWQPPFGYYDAEAHGGGR